MSIGTILTIILLSSASDFTVGGIVSWTHGYTRHQDLSVGAMAKGQTAPDDITIGQIRCVKFDQTKPNETVHAQFRIPSDWKNTTDIEIDIHAFAESGDAILDTEVVQWDITYRSVSDTEPYDNGSAATVSVTWTQSGAGVDKAGFHAHATLPYNDANQPLSNNDEILASIDLNEGATTYSGNPSLCMMHVTHTAVLMPQN